MSVAGIKQEDAGAGQARGLSIRGLNKWFGTNHVVSYLILIKEGYHMFKNIARTLANIARSAIKPASQSLPVLNKHGNELSARELSFYGRGKGGKVSHKKGNAAQLKRASKKASNISKFN